jgi:hypothetical protein
MGIFWDLVQQDEIEKQKEQASSVEERVKLLEEDLANTKILLRKTLIALETHLVIDIDGDGKTG